MTKDDCKVEECRDCARYPAMKDYPGLGFKSPTRSWLGYDCIRRWDNDLHQERFMHFGDPDFVLRGDSDPQKGSALFFRPSGKYVYLEYMSKTMLERGEYREHLPVVRLCKPCAGLMGEYLWSQYFPREYMHGYEQDVLTVLKELAADPNAESDEVLMEYARRIVHGCMACDW